MVRRKKDGNLLFFLILIVFIVSFYQFITNAGEFIANVLGVDLVTFWLLVVVVLFIVLFLSGVNLSDLKRRLDR